MACIGRALLQCLIRQTSSKYLCFSLPSLTDTRNYRLWRGPYNRELYRRRLKAGPEKLKPRSVWPNWDYESEVYCFGKRISEEISQELLKTAFMHRSYENVLKELMKESFGESDELPEFKCNESFISKGRNFSSHTLQNLLKEEFPNLPVDGINAVCDFLMSNDKLAYVGSNLGIRDLIRCQEFPVPDSLTGDTLMAVIGALVEEQGEKRGSCFVADFLLTQLIGEDIDEIYPIENAMGKLIDILKSQGLAEPEPRLLDHFGSQTAMSCFYVGIYSNEELIGQAPGETMTIAEDMAAKDALMRFYGITDNRTPIDYSRTYRDRQSQFTSSKQELLSTSS